MKYAGIVREAFKKNAVFSIKDLRILLDKNGISRPYSNLLTHNLLAKGELKRIAKGIYSFQDDVMVAGFAFSPFYYGLQEALSLRNLWEQETIPVILTPKRVRTGIRKIMGSNVLVRRIDRKMFFGFDMVKYYDLWLPVSTPEKTLIDFIYFKEHLPKQALEELKAKIDNKKLEQCLKRCSRKLKKKVKQAIGK